ncbi:L-lactate dehydrogenase [Clostridium aestuarii]|uniref:L-lactate dehydrogenase n=1 Tax=Clostridium aestuarii TaxID=338193 RepID=A0ABT4CYY2_9CLOT|nr:L-lactate dehydrogenase [Clostridium aestuarii]MCY6484188.1 L-lactate dehydrogenase [Clostridium aestuarii]
MNTKRTKISIIGAGYVGATSAYALMMAGFASEIVIVDINKEKAVGEAMDLSHGVSFLKPVEVYAGNYKDTADSDIVIITAGAAQKPGETRLDLINKNFDIFKKIIPQIVKYNPNAILLVVANPVDILTYITYKLSGFPKERVIGSGTVLDTSRFKHLLSEHFNIDDRNIHTYIIGEHGDSEVATWSLTNIGCMNINYYCNNICKKCDGLSKYEIHESVKNAGYEIINKKGATYFAVGLAIKRIVEAILRDENSILTVSSLLEGQYGINDVYVGIPTIVGSSGIKKVLEVPLNEEELIKFKDSATHLKGYIDKLKF